MDYEYSFKKRDIKVYFSKTFGEHIHTFINSEIKSKGDDIWITTGDKITIIAKNRLLLIEVVDKGREKRRIE